MLQEAFVFVFAPVLVVIEPYYKTLQQFLLTPKIHRFVLKAIVFAILFSLLFVGALIAYSTLYALYIPQVSFTRTLHLVPQRPPASGPLGIVMLSDVLVGKGPTATSSAVFGTSLYSTSAITKAFFPAQTQIERRFMAQDQPYDLKLELEVPTSPHNQHIGSFAVHTSLTNANGTNLYYSGRSGTLHYRSDFARFMSHVFFSIPIGLFGYSLDYQTIRIPLLEALLSPAPMPPPSDEDIGQAKKVAQQYRQSVLARATKRPDTDAQPNTTTIAASSTGWWFTNTESTSNERASADSDSEVSQNKPPADHDEDEDTATLRAPYIAQRAYAAMHSAWRWAYASAQAVSEMNRAVDPALPYISLVPKPPARFRFAPYGRGAGGLGKAETRDVSMAVIQLSENLHVHRATLRVDAQFYGLRYFMYHWFLTSATIGIGTFMIWEVLLGLALWRIGMGKRIRMPLQDVDLLLAKNTEIDIVDQVISMDEADDVSEPYEESVGSEASNSKDPPLVQDPQVAVRSSVDEHAHTGIMRHRKTLDTH